MRWLQGFEPICKEYAALAPLTWYKLGGPARWLFEPADSPTLAALLVRLREAQVPWRVLGRGANLLVPDAGFDGAVISLRAGGFEDVQFTDECVTAGAGADFPSLIRTAMNESRVGLEALAGIPGAVGGAIRMNAGGRYGEIGRFVKDITVIDTNGAERVLSAADVGFSYRRTQLDHMVITSARFALPFGDRAAAEERYRKIWIEKHDQQPPVAARSAGCIFKNPHGSSAGLLIDRAGLKGFRVGGARISERHANFIVADNAARSEDVLRLIDEARDRVRRDANVELELEIQIW